jgi:hypothetical protein
MDRAARFLDKRSDSGLYSLQAACTLKFQVPLSFRIIREVLVHQNQMVRNLIWLESKKKSERETTVQINTTDINISGKKYHEK